jgi:tetratricopeptide (TPR) repeat protein
VALAAEYDDATRRALARISAARAAGDAETLIALAQNDKQEWRVTSLLRCKVAESLIEIRESAAAVSLLDEVIAAFPRSIRPQQLKGLALARQGQWQAAQQLLGELVALGERDPETLGMLARTWRDRYAHSRDRLHLGKARNLYAQAFASAPSDYYTGINAAANSVLLGDLDDAETYAAAVEGLVGNLPIPGDYWRTATVAEVQLIRRNFLQAARLYAHAIGDDPEAKASHESTRGQARRLMEHLSPSDEERQAIESAFTSGL